MNELLTKPSPLFLDGWLEFNRERWGLEPRRVRYTPKGRDVPALEAVLYLDRRGRVRMPPRNPYLPVRFVPTAAEKPGRIATQWRGLSEQLARELQRRRVRGFVGLPPGVIDAREFQWAGFRVGIRYTFIGALPHPREHCAGSLRTDCRKAQRLGYRAGRASDWESITRCLAATGEAKGFSHRTGSSDLQLVAQSMGNDHLRAYAGFAPSGEMVCAHILLHVRGGVAIGWSQGTDREHLASGINKLVSLFSFEDLTENGASAMDLVGANLREVAAAKADYGFQLVPYLTLEERNARSLVRDCISMFDSVSRWAHALRRSWFP